nr:substrate-binding domain-containing protein [Agromyces seonyuensis]
MIAGGGYVVATSGILDATASTAQEPGCADPVAIDVVASASIADVVESIAADFDETGCTETSVASQSPADTAAVLASGGQIAADVWIPDGEVWVDRMYSVSSSLGRAAPRVDVDKPVASTPVIFATPAARAGDFGDSLSWTSILDAGVAAVLPDPEGSSASLAGLAALSDADGGDQRRLNAALIELGKAIPASTEAAFGSIVAAPKPTVAIASEHDVVEFNRAETGDQLAAVFPKDGTVSVGYPFVRVGNLSAEDGLTDAVNAFEAALRDAADVFTEAGFRDGKGEGVVTAPGIVATASPAPSADDAQNQLKLLRTWGVLTLRTRLLAVIDVSGSMEEPASNGLRRIDVFQQAAMGAVSKFSGEMELGVWIFSSGRNGDLDYEDLLPIEPLADAAHTQQIAGVIQSLPGRLGGGTALYDSTFAAVKRVRETYDADKINAVLLITDGKNEDDTEGLSLDQLLANLEQLQQEAPEQQVPVIMIGFGPDTDLDAMTKIAKVTGGAAYSAEKPEDLGTVLVDALTQRTCRPDCEG